MWRQLKQSTMTEDRRFIGALGVERSKVVYRHFSALTLSGSPRLHSRNLTSLCSYVCVAIFMPEAILYK